MAIETPVSDTDKSTAPLDGMARYLASRKASDKPVTAVVIDAPAVVADPDPEPEPETQPKGAAVVAKAAPVDAVLDPETGEAIENPTRNDRRIAKLWKREQEAITERDRLRKLLDERNAAPLVVDPQTAGRPDNNQALTFDQQLTDAAKARIRTEPDENEIGKTYQTYEAFVKDCAIWGGELAAEKHAIKAEQAIAQTAMASQQQAFATSYAEQSKLYPDFNEKLKAATDLDLGPVIDSVIKNTPDFTGHLTYWAATNPDDVSRIRALAPGLQLVEMGKVMAGLNVSSAVAGDAPKKLSRAPVPAREIGRPAGPVSTKLEDVKTYGEFQARREADLRSKRAAR